jgi:hypothetical protein
MIYHGFKHSWISLLGYKIKSDWSTQENQIYYSKGHKFACVPKTISKSYNGDPLAWLHMTAAISKNKIHPLKEKHLNHWRCSKQCATTNCSAT